VAAHEDLRPYRYGSVDIWTAGFMRPDVPEAALRDFARRDDGTHLLLLHASDMSQVPEGVTPYKPILPAQVQEAGFRHALLGHYHDGRSAESITYPGSPEPLGWNESGRHCTALLTMECSDRFAYLEFADHSRVSHDLEAAAQEFTSRGEMVRKLVDHKQGSRQEEQAVSRALQLALDAFDE